MVYEGAKLALRILEENPRAHSDWTLVLRKHELLKSISTTGAGIHSLDMLELEL